MRDAEVAGFLRLAQAGQQRAGGRISPEQDQRAAVVIDATIVKRRLMAQIEQALIEVVMKYMMNNPRYLKLTNITVIAYVCINSGIFNVIRHLILPNPYITFDQMVKGLTQMILSYVDAEMAKAG